MWIIVGNYLIASGVLEHWNGLFALQKVDKLLM